jgi:secondary thiamine-phosphate synthase enzyme
MKSHTHYLWFETRQRQEIIDITADVEAQVTKSGVREGFVLVSAMHISASVFVNDHESGLWQDILAWLEGTIAPWDPARYRHNETGEDNAAAHLRSLTVGHEVIVPITAGKLDFGPWQRVFYGEWDGRRRKRVIIKVLGVTWRCTSTPSGRGIFPTRRVRGDSSRASRWRSSPTSPSRRGTAPAAST